MITSHSILYLSVTFHSNATWCRLRLMTECLWISSFSASNFRNINPPRIEYPITIAHKPMFEKKNVVTFLQQLKHLSHFVFFFWYTCSFLEAGCSLFVDLGISPTVVTTTLPSMYMLSSSSVSGPTRRQQQLQHPCFRFVLIM